MTKRDMDSKQLLNNLFDGKDLTSKEAEFLLEKIIRGELTSSQVAGFLIGLRTKGETVEEIVGLIKGMRKHMIEVRSAKFEVRSSIDVCGTGGDGVGAFNISTAVAFVVAACGINVAKHGNRAASSKCGSADVLEALGVHIMVTPQQAAEVLQKVGMVFLFAPLFHPAMKQIAPIRKKLGVRTVFNFLGPFLNPAGVKRQLIGVPNGAIAKKLAQVAAKLDYEHTMIIASKDGMDEISLSAPTHIFEVKGKKITSKIVTSSQFGIKRASLSTIAGGDAARNSAIIVEILAGKKSPYRDIVVLNSAFALYVAGKVKTPKAGIVVAQEAIDSGTAMQTLEKLIKETKKYA